MFMPQVSPAVLVIKSSLKKRVGVYLFYIEYIYSPLCTILFRLACAYFSKTAEVAGTGTIERGMTTRCSYGNFTNRISYGLIRKLTVDLYNCVWKEHPVMH
jgi:hypothetical protein